MISSRVLAYRVHFLYLAVAAAVLAGVGAEPFGMSLGPMTFVLYGALHSIALVLALRLAGSWLKRLLFVALAASLSALVPYFGVVSARGLAYFAGASFVAVFAIGSLGGAASYWLMVRFFWMSGLSAFSLLRTVGFCVVATLLAVFSAAAISGFGASPSRLGDMVPPVAWWFAFSLSLCFAERASDRQTG